MVDKVIKHDGLGWPKTYFIWGWMCGAFATLAAWQAAMENYGSCIAMLLFAAASFYMARIATRPIFSE